MKRGRNRRRQISSSVAQQSPPQHQHQHQRKADRSQRMHPSVVMRPPVPLQPRVPAAPRQPHISGDYTPAHSLGSSVHSNVHNMPMDWNTMPGLEYSQGLFMHNEYMPNSYYPYHGNMATPYPYMDMSRDMAPYHYDTRPPLPPPQVAPATLPIQSSQHSSWATPYAPVGSLMNLHSNPNASTTSNLNTNTNMYRPGKRGPPDEAPSLSNSLRIPQNTIQSNNNNNNNNNNNTRKVNISSRNTPKGNSIEIFDQSFDSNRLSPSNSRKQLPLDSQENRMESSDSATTQVRPGQSNNNNTRRTTSTMDNNIEDRDRILESEISKKKAKTETYENADEMTDKNTAVTYPSTCATSSDQVGSGKEEEIVQVDKSTEEEHIVIISNMEDDSIEVVTDVDNISNNDDYNSISKNQLIPADAIITKNNESEDTYIEVIATPSLRPPEVSQALHIQTQETLYVTESQSSSVNTSNKKISKKLRPPKVLRPPPSTTSKSTVSHNAEPETNVTIQTDRNNQSKSPGLIYLDIPISNQTIENDIVSNISSKGFSTDSSLMITASCNPPKAANTSTETSGASKDIIECGEEISDVLSPMNIQSQRNLGSGVTEHYQNKEVDSEQALREAVLKSLSKNYNINNNNQRNNSIENNCKIDTQISIQNANNDKVSNTTQSKSSISADIALHNCKKYEALSCNVSSSSNVSDVSSTNKMDVETEDGDDERLEFGLSYLTGSKISVYQESTYLGDCTDSMVDLTKEDVSVDSDDIDEYVDRLFYDKADDSRGVPIPADDDDDNDYHDEEEGVCDKNLEFTNDSTNIFDETRISVWSDDTTTNKMNTVVDNEVCDDDVNLKIDMLLEDVMQNLQHTESTLPSSGIEVVPLNMKPSTLRIDKAAGEEEEGDQVKIVDGNNNGEGSNFKDDLAMMSAIGLNHNNNNNNDSNSALLLERKKEVEKEKAQLSARLEWLRRREKQAQVCLNYIFLKLK